MISIANKAGQLCAMALAVAALPATAMAQDKTGAGMSVDIPQFSPKKHCSRQVILNGLLSSQEIREFHQTCMKEELSSFVGLYEVWNDLNIGLRGVCGIEEMAEDYPSYVSLRTCINTRARPHR